MQITDPRKFQLCKNSHKSIPQKRLRPKGIALALSLALGCCFGAIPVAKAESTIPATDPTTAEIVGTQKTCPKPIFMAYYRTWRDIKMPEYANSDLPDKNVIKMTDLPEGVDIVSLFHYANPQKIDEAGQKPFWDAVKYEYVPELHKRGTKVIRSVGVDEIFKEEYGLSVSATDDVYDKAAQQMLNKFVIADGIDGFDIDMEKSLSPDEVVIMHRAFKALSKYLGPKSNTGKLLIYDTNMDMPESHVDAVAPYIDYVFAQTYGRSVQSIANTWNTYAPYISSCQFLPGYTYPEEGDPYNRWEDAFGPVESSKAMEKAKWQPEGGEKGGIFAYAIDRDGRTYSEPDFSHILPTDFKYAKAVIAEIKKGHVNPPNPDPNPNPNPNPNPDPTDSKAITVFGGEDRITTALAAAKTNQKSKVVLIGYNSLADGLTGGTLAQAEQANLLYTTSHQLDPRVKEFFHTQKVSEVTLLGGAGSLSPQIETELQSLGVKVRRIGGIDRYETANKIAAELAKLRGMELNKLPLVFARGDIEADALVAGPLAHKVNGAVLLTKEASLTSSQIESLKQQTGSIYTVGGGAQNAIKQVPNLSNLLKDSFTGADRYATAALLAQKHFSPLSAVALAHGYSTADAIVANSYSNTDSALPILLSTSDYLPSTTKNLLHRGMKVTVFGGSQVIKQSVLQELKSLL